MYCSRNISTPRVCIIDSVASKGADDSCHTQHGPVKDVVYAVGYPLVYLYLYLHGTIAYYLHMEHGNISILLRLRSISQLD
jgi:hypothetical protein